MVDERSFEWLDRGRQYTAVLTAFTLPISTSGTAISVSLLVILTLLSTSRDEWHSTLRSPSAILPIALFALIAVSMLWSPQPFGPGGVSHYAKLLLIPLLMASTFSHRQAIQIAHGFAAACAVLLALSVASLIWQSGPWGWFKGPGVPVKDNATQSTCFAICAFGLALYAIHHFKVDDKLRGCCTATFALLLFADMFLISLSKTGALVAAALVACFLARIDGWPRRLIIAIPLILIAVVASALSDEAQRRVNEINTDLRALGNISPNLRTTPPLAITTAPLTAEALPADAPLSSDLKAPHSVSDAINAPPPKPTMSTASRIDFWWKALEFVRDAPLIGHGAGSTKSLYATLEKERPSPYGEAVPDPHNQFLAVAIQAGLLGGVLLITLWMVHLTLFFGDGIPRALGQAVVIQNVVSSLFNSSLSQVTQGMFYCLAVGVLGALIRRRNERAVNPHFRIDQVWQKTPKTKAT